MDCRFIQEELNLIQDHLTNGTVDPNWLATHCQILTHYAENLQTQNSRKSKNPLHNILDSSRGWLPDAPN